MEKKENSIYDIIIIGAGPSGLTAAIYGLREGLKVLVLEKIHVGGNLTIIDKLNNYPSYDEIHGGELADKLEHHVRQLGGEITFQSVDTLRKNGDVFQVYADGETSYEGYSVVVATGTREKHLGIPNEDKYIGRGISFCSLCDGPLFRKKRVAVVGGGDRAYTEALHLSSFASEVLILQRSEPRAEKVNIEHVLSTDNIKVISDVEVIEINGESRLESVLVRNKNTKKTEVITINGLFPLIGNIPNTDFLSPLPILNKDGYVVVDTNMQTSIKGLYAVGDVIDKTIRQVASAVGDGAVAGAMASRYVKLLKK